MDYTVAKAYGPISLTSFLLKGLEKLVDRYLRTGRLASIPIYPRQHAFQAGKCTESALHQLVGRIERALEATQYTLGVFFYIKGAFDNTSCKSVRHALEDRKVHWSIRIWIVTMLQHRTIMVKTDLSPMLWSVVADSLLRWLSKKECLLKDTSMTVLYLFAASFWPLSATSRNVWSPASRNGAKEPVSYTHLTLPTNREV